MCRICSYRSCQHHGVFSLFLTPSCSQHGPKNCHRLNIWPGCTSNTRTQRCFSAWFARQISSGQLDAKSKDVVIEAGQMFFAMSCCSIYFTRSQPLKDIAALGVVRKAFHDAIRKVGERWWEMSKNWWLEYSECLKMSEVWFSHLFSLQLSKFLGRDEEISEGFLFQVAKVASKNWSQGGLQVLQSSDDAKVVVPELVRFLTSMQEAGRPICSIRSDQKELSYS